MTQGLILAGGYSARANTNKMLLMYENKPLILHAIDGMMPFVSQVFVVTGHYHNQIHSFLKDYPKVTCIENKNYNQGMFSSVLTGVSALSEDFFILPGDCPFVGQETYKKLLLGKKKIRVPSFHGKCGHPLFMKKELLTELMMEKLDSNLKNFRNKFDVEYILVDDEKILIDIDTLEDFRSLNPEKKVK